MKSKSTVVGEEGIVGLRGVVGFADEDCVERYERLQEEHGTATAGSKPIIGSVRELRISSKEGLEDTRTTTRPPGHLRRPQSERSCVVCD